MSLFAGDAISTGGTDGTRMAASFNKSSSITLAPDGNFYVAEAWNHRVRKITSAAVVTTLAGMIQGFEDGTGSAAKFNNPLGIEADLSGNIYIAGTYNNRIRKITPPGVVSTFAGTGSSSSEDGPVLASRFNDPFCIARDANGVLYIGEPNNSKNFRKINNGRVESVVGYVDAIAGSTLTINGVSGIVINAAGVIYFSDHGNHRVCRVSLK